MILCSVLILFVVLLLLVWRKRLSPILKKSLLLVLAASVFGLLSAIGAWQEPVLTEGIRLARNPVGEGDYEQRIVARTGKERAELVLTVPEQRLTAAQEQQYLAAAKEEITVEFPGENESVDKIDRSVVLRSSYQSGLVEAEWKFTDEVIDYRGNIVMQMMPEEGIVTEASVTLTCGDSQSIYRFPIRVYPKKLSRSELFAETLMQVINRDGERRGTQYLTLPEKIMEMPVTFSVPNNFMPEKIVLFGVIVALLLPAAEQNRQREKKKKREKELLLEYPDIVSKLALLLGAGMSLSGAWERIVSSYAKGKMKGHREILPAYEEMCLTVHEIQSGAGELKAYQHFGERCGLQRYRRLGNILAQNMKKGNHRLMELLLQEAEAAFEERRSLAKKYGEEAGTKMLFPMMALLLVMMTILLVPALLSFQM